VVTHRARKTFTEDTADDYLGLDAGGLKVGLGLRYGVLPFLDVGLYRVNGTAEIFDTYEFDLKVQLLKQEQHFVDLAVRPGASWFRQPGMDDASGFFGQLLASRTCRRRLTLGAGLLYHSDSSSAIKSTDDDDESLAAQALVEFRLTPAIAWNLEMASNLSGYGESRPALSTSFKVLTHRHTFALVISNTQYGAADGIVTNAWREWDDLIFGFNITREIQL
jgi:hypothetical protein